MKRILRMVRISKGYFIVISVIHIKASYVFNKGWEINQGVSSISRWTSPYHQMSNKHLTFPLVQHTAWVNILLGVIGR